MVLYNSFMKGNTWRTLIILQLVCFIFLFLPVTNSFARDVSFIWTANQETVDGYRIYYKTGSSGASYDGTGS